MLVGTKHVHATKRPACPETPMRLTRQCPEESGFIAALILAPHAIKRFVKVVEAIALIAFLLCDEPKYITRETIRIDDGMYA